MQSIDMQSTASPSNYHQKMISPLKISEDPSPRSPMGGTWWCTGKCADHDGKPIEAKLCSYNEDLGEQGKQLKWLEKEKEEVRLRKYPVCEMNGFIYVWIHAMQEHQNEPLWSNINCSAFLCGQECKAKAIVDV